MRFPILWLQVHFIIKYDKFLYRFVELLSFAYIFLICIMYAYCKLFNPQFFEEMYAFLWKIIWLFTLQK